MKEKEHNKFHSIDPLNNNFLVNLFMRRRHSMTKFLWPSMAICPNMLIHHTAIKENVFNSIFETFSSSSFSFFSFNLIYAYKITLKCLTNRMPREYAVLIEGNYSFSFAQFIHFKRSRCFRFNDLHLFIKRKKKCRQH